MAEQFSLFADQKSGPEGLRLADDFVSPDVEDALISEIAALPLTPFQFGAYEGKRRVASFGFSYDYTLRRLAQAEPIPEWLGSVVGKVEDFGGPATRIHQVLCTEYDVGVGIGWHRDKPHFDRVFGLSLGSDCKLRFRRQVSTKWERFALEARARSIYLMSGRRGRNGSTASRPSQKGAIRSRSGPWWGPSSWDRPSSSNAPRPWKSPLILPRPKKPLS